MKRTTRDQARPWRRRNVPDDTSRPIWEEGCDTHERDARQREEAGLDVTLSQLEPGSGPWFIVLRKIDKLRQKRISIEAVRVAREGIEAIREIPMPWDVAVGRAVNDG